MRKAMIKVSVNVVLVLGLLTLLVAVVPVSAASGNEEWFHAAGSNTYIVGGYGDNFVYDGEGYQPTDGFLSIDVSDEENTGLLIATWEAEDYYGYNGTFVAIMDVFAGAEEWKEGGIATNLTIHGDTGRGPPVLPEVYTYIGGWGEGDIYVNGELVFENLDAHFMITEGTRDPITHAVYNANKTGFYSPMNTTDSITYPERILTHVVLHSLEGDENNFPQFDVFMHINYENTATFEIDTEKGIGSN